MTASFLKVSAVIQWPGPCHAIESRALAHIDNDWLTLKRFPVRLMA